MFRILICKGVSKTYPNGLEALKEANFDVRESEIHAIVGENGAGKSTLMNILFGLIRPTSGEISFNGKNFAPNHPVEAIELGIGMVHQHFKLVDSLTVAENVVLGLERTFQNKLGKIDREAINESVGKLIEKLNLVIGPRDVVGSLPISKQQLVEILKVLYREAEFIILDEPTAVLAPSEVEGFLEFVSALREMGKTVVFISHRLREVFAIADRITILRRGVTVGTYNTKDVDHERVAHLMIGSKMELIESPSKNVSEEVIFSVEALKSDGKTLKEISFDLHKGEILGVAGVGGNGQEELFEVLTGELSVNSGEILLKGKSITNLDIFERRRVEIAYVTDDRMKKGIAPDRNIIENCIAGHHKSGRFGKVIVNHSRAKKFAEQIIADYDVRTSKNLNTEVRALSGGNMQKLLVGREIAFDPVVLVAAQPTAGVDIAARKLIHDSFRAIVASGSGIILISGELEELIGLSNRIIILYRGRIVAEMRHPNYDATKMSYYMTGIKGGTPNEQSCQT